MTFIIIKQNMCSQDFRHGFAAISVMTDA